MDGTVNLVAYDEWKTLSRKCIYTRQFLLIPFWTEHKLLWTYKQDLVVSRVPVVSSCPPVISLFHCISLVFKCFCDSEKELLYFK